MPPPPLPSATQIDFSTLPRSSASGAGCGWVALALTSLFLASIGLCAADMAIKCAAAPEERDLRGMDEAQVIYPGSTLEHEYFERARCVPIDPGGGGYNIFRQSAPGRTYSVSAAEAEVKAYYRTELLKRGWTVGPYNATKGRARFSMTTAHDSALWVGGPYRFSVTLFLERP
jgi:hypothetical protein